LTIGSRRLYLLGYDPVAAGFSLRLFAQVKTCGYHSPFAQPKGCGYHLFIGG